MRIMGLDYGSKTIGVAVSDPLGLTAQGVEIIRREEENKLRKSLRRVEELVKKYEVEKIVLGFPKNMNNTIGERAEKSLPAKRNVRTKIGAARCHVGRKAYDSRSQPHTYGNRCAKREQR